MLARSIFRRFVSNQEGQVVVWQRPNAPLLVWILASALGLFVHGKVHTLIGALGTVSIVIWAALEVFSGESPFRRTLGVVVLLTVVIGLILGH